MTRLQTLFESYGVDWPRTMDRFVGSEELYVECLDMLLADDNLPALRASLAAGDMKAAFDAAHTLKGVAANMGLAPLLTAVSIIVEPLRTDERMDYSPLLAQIEREFDHIRRLRDQI